MGLLELFLLLQRLLLTLQHDILLQLHAVHLEHPKHRVLPVLILPQEHFLFVFNLVQFSPLLSPLLSKSLLKQRLLFVVLLWLATTLLLERLLEKRQQLVCRGG